MSNFWKKIKDKQRVVITFTFLAALLAVTILLSKNSSREIFPHAQIIPAHTTFKPSETLKFTVQLGEKKPKPSIFSLVTPVQAASDPLSVKLENMTLQKDIDVPVKISDPSAESYELAIDTSKKSLRPGVYTIYTTLSKDGQTKTLEQSFYYGVLAINTNKSIYQPGEKALLQMATLNSDGHTVCNANLNLTIESPDGAKQVFTSVDKTIQASSSCGADNVTDLPDYTASYQTVSPGIYKITLTNKDTDYEITDSFEVRNSVAFDVERTSATRINPFKAAYTMHINIKTNEDFKGEMVETVPSDFVILNLFQDLKEIGKQVRSDSGMQFITWRVDLKKGESTSLEYTYQSPKVSPGLFQVGPLKIGSFEEIRQWQLASDGSCTSAAGGGNWGTGGTWGAGCTGAGGIPAAGDAVTIGNNATVTGNTTVSIASLTISNGATLTFASQSPTITLTGTTGPVLSNSGTYTAGSETITISGAATMTITSGTITLNNLQLTPTLSAATTYTLGSGDLTANGSLDVNPSKSGNPARLLTVNLGAALTIGGTFTITASGCNGGGGTATATVNTTSANHYNITAGKIVSTTSCTLTANTSTITLNGTSGTLLTCTSQTCTLTSATVVFSSDAAVTLISTSPGAIAKLNITPTITNNRTYTMGASALTIGTGGFTINPTDNTGAHTLSFNMSGNIGVDITATTLIEGSGSGPATGKLDAVSTYGLSSGQLDIETNGAYDAQASTISLSDLGNGNGSRVQFTKNGGTFTPGTSTVQVGFVDSSSETMFSGSSITLYNLAVSAGVTADRLYDMGADLTVNHNFSVTEQGTGGWTLTVGIRNTTVIGETRADRGGGTTNFSKITTINNSGPDYSLSTGTIYLNTGGALTANSSTITLTGTSGTVFSDFGTFTAGTSTVDVAPASGTAVSLGSGITYNNLTIDAPSGMTVTIAGSSTIGSPGNLTINSGTLSDNLSQITGNSSGTLSVAAGATLKIAAAFPTNFTGAHISLATTSTVRYTFRSQTISSTPSYGNLTIDPLVDLDGTFTFGSGTTTINGNFTISPVSGDGGIITVNMGGNIVVASGKITTIQGDSFTTAVLDTISGSNYALTTGALDIEAYGTLTANNSNITVSGNFTNNGTFTAGGSTVIFNDNSQVSTITGATTFNNFQSTTASKTIKFQKATTGAPVFSFGGTFLMQGSTSILRSDTNGSQWLADFSSAQGTGNVTNTTITDSGCSTSATVTLNGTNTNGLNNDTCWSFAAAPATTNFKGKMTIHSGTFH